mmetsp:Transcript_2195/g.6074  ORF Transcript_2195/g.6074 Transcript_2195/m.6074 type:complete len:805 (-) Transcript_2195:1358-3772(-)|eukprot:CAMPEP_0119128244 /NCGR_PEP_ID=MMETSP1310-20130426/6472_1 /TAXON_ID=464262 /ORGANISM="Genus nov. species nov., Strain RCC2339" /LENGTH=804 /DNA_ID=CAMNT_0007118565 /DNA_START=113 /DNA_END=2527 /DNA_ORIENTATION=-
MPSVLLLGSGLCAPPLVTYLLDHGVALVIATRTKERAEKLIAGRDNATAVELDVSKEGAMDKVDELAQGVDLVVSLLPYIYHVQTAKVALKHKKHFCTASYIAPEMEELDAQAKEAGVVMINECGVDPGLDHMSAQRVIDDVHSKGGKVLEFFSICGGLPAPASNNNPLGYKLSWSPRGVLLAGRNNAVFLEHGEKKAVAGVDLYATSHYRKDRVEPVGDLEWYANRDSIKYIDIYRIPEVRTIIRGTYRYPGWCDAMRKFALFGFTSMDEVAYGGRTYAEFTAQVLGLPSTDGLREQVAAKLEVPADGDVLHRLAWVGALSTEERVPEGVSCALDAMSHLFEEKMQYAPGEKDMICMKHTFEVEYTDGRREQITSKLIDYGHQPEGNTSMSRTVALPLAIAVRAVLEGRIAKPGVQRPVTPEVYNLILDEMEKHDVKFTEEVQPQHVIIRHEVKPMEERTPLSPVDVAKVVKAGIRVSVERSPTRCFPDAEYEAAGATLVPAGSWVDAPASTIILGLKELPEGDAPIYQRHVYFAHCYKGQDGAAALLSRFHRGRGSILDIEFLVSEQGRRVAAFGFPAGVMGAALGLLQWAKQKVGGNLDGPLKPWPSYESLVAEVKAAIAAAGATPRVYVLGALGRAGKGAVQLSVDAGLDPVKWDLEETKGGGPFPELVNEADVLVNCIYLSTKIPPFVTLDMLEKDHRLAVVSDVSCDTTNPNNPLPIYSSNSTMVKPIDAVMSADGSKKVCDVMSIDHLPSLLPHSSSVSFSADFVPHFLNIADPDHCQVWSRAFKLYQDMVIDHVKL